jgi:hypothetical protein
MQIRKAINLMKQGKLKELSQYLLTLDPKVKAQIEKRLYNK